MLTLSQFVIQFRLSTIETKEKGNQLPAVRDLYALSWSEVSRPDRLDWTPSLRDTFTTMKAVITKPSPIQKLQADPSSRDNRLS